MGKQRIEYTLGIKPDFGPGLSRAKSELGAFARTAVTGMAGANADFANRTSSLSSQAKRRAEDSEFRAFVASRRANSAAFMRRSESAYSAAFAGLAHGQTIPRPGAGGGGGGGGGGGFFAGARERFNAVGSMSRGGMLRAAGVGGIAFAASEALGRVGDTLKNIAIAARTGGSALQALNDGLESLPIFGGGWRLGKGIKEWFTGDEARDIKAAERLRENARLEAKEQDRRNSELQFASGMKDRLEEAGSMIGLTGLKAEIQEIKNRAKAEIKEIRRNLLPGEERDRLERMSASNEQRDIADATRRAERETRDRQAAFAEKQRLRQIEAKAEADALIRNNLFAGRQALGGIRPMGLGMLGNTYEHRLAAGLAGIRQSAGFAIDGASTDVQRRAIKLRAELEEIQLRRSLGVERARNEFTGSASVGSPELTESFRGIELAAEAQQQADMLAEIRAIVGGNERIEEILAEEQRIMQSIERQLTEMKAKIAIIGDN